MLRVTHRATSLMIQRRGVPYRCAQSLSDYKFTEFCRNGDVTSRHVARTDFLSETRLGSRVFRKIDPLFSSRRPCLAFQDGVVVIALENTVRAVVWPDKLLLFCTGSTTEHRAHSLLKSGFLGRRPTLNEFSSPTLNNRLRYFEDQNNTAVVTPEDEFPVRGVESLLMHYAAVLDYQLSLLNECTEHVLGQLFARVNNEILIQQLLPLKGKLAEFEVQIKEYRQALQDVLQSDEDILEMRKISGQSDPALQYHFEMLIESASQGAEAMSNKAQELIKTVAGSEKVLEISLHSSRNRLMRLNLFVSTGAFVVGTGALIASLFGMNLPIPHSIESLRVGGVGSFEIVGGALVGLTATLSVACYRYYQLVWNAVRFDMRGHAALRQLLPHASTLEKALYRDFGEQASLSKEAISTLVAANTPVRLSRPDLDALTLLLDFDSSGQVEIGSLMTVLKTSAKTASQ